MSDYVVQLQAVDAALDGAVADIANANPHITISVKAGVPAKLAGKSFTRAAIEHLPFNPSFQMG